MRRNQIEYCQCVVIKLDPFKPYVETYRNCTPEQLSDVERDLKTEYDSSNNYQVITNKQKICM